MPAELKQVSAKLQSFPSGSPAARAGSRCRGESCQRCKGLFTRVLIFSWELRGKAELLFLAEHSRENLLLSLLC